MVDLIINGGTATLDGIKYYDNVSITNGGILNITACDGTGSTGTLTLNITNNVTIDSISRIIGAKRGRQGGLGGQGGSYDTNGSSAGSAGVAGTTGIAGAGGTNGYGGTAAGATYTINIIYNNIMGNGAGGGGGGMVDQCWSNPGGNGEAGGGSLTINAANMYIHGIIDASGGNGGSGGYSSCDWAGSGGGGSAGGSIWLSVNNVMDISNATITTAGGNGGAAGGYGGDGGPGTSGAAGQSGGVKIVYGSLINTGTSVISGTVYYGIASGAAYFTSSPTGARIWIDNIDKLLNTPNTISSLSTGNHTYKLVSGIYTATGTFTVTADMTTNVSVTIATTIASVESNLYTCVGPCQAIVTTTWQNLGNSSVTFKPWILIDGTTSLYATLNTTITPGSISGPVAIATSMLSYGQHNICIFPD